MTADVSRSTYWPQLDGLRTVAVGVVIVGHAWLRHVHGAGVGVALFFALSGFLITTLLIHEHEQWGRVDVPRFYGRRALRLLPALIAMVALTWPVLRAPLADVAAALLYYANWWRIAGHDMGPYGHTWSLAIEEQFYFIWPWLFVAAFAWRRVRGVAATALALCAVATLLRVPMADDPWRTYHGLDTRMDSLLAGALLATGLHLAPAITTRLVRWLALPGLIVVGAMAIRGDEILPPPVSLTVLTWSCVALVGFLVTRPHSWASRLLSTRPVVWLGTISYGLYLWHFPILAWLAHQGWMSYALRLPLVALLTVAAASISFYGFERPVSRRLRRHVKPGPRPRTRALTD